MGPKLRALLDLQNVELQIVDIRRQLARRERAVTAQAKRLQSLRNELASEREKLQRTQIEVNEADLDLKARTGHIDRMRERLNTVKTNKEYAAVLAELNNEKADVAKIETRALEVMGKLEEEKKAFAERESSEQSEIDRLQDLETQLANSQGSFAEKLGRLEAQKQEALAQVNDSEALTLFDRLSDRYDGEAMAAINRTHPRRDEFTCDGCYMALNVELANAVLSRDEVVTCKNCGRILWMEKGQ